MKNKNYKDSIKSGVIFAISALVIFTIAGITYAATVSNGQTLTADLFNEKTVPTGAVMSFNLNACPPGWKIADGTNGTRDLRNEFIRGVSSTRILGNKEYATAVGTISEIGGGNDIYFGADQNTYPRDYDEATTGNGSTPRTGRLLVNGTFQSVPERINLIKVRPTNVALLYCEKE